MRRAASLLIRLAPLLSVLIVPACFSLPKVDVIRVVDDFAEDAGLKPTWNAFNAAWECTTFINSSKTGQDGGAVPLTSPDGGQLVSCGTVPHADDNQALISTFDVVAPAGSDIPGNLTFGAAITTTITGVGQANLSSFKELSFEAQLYSINLMQAGLPVGTTALEVELGCFTNTMNPTAITVNHSVEIKIEADWPAIQPLVLDSFTLPGSTDPYSGIQSCLATVTSISFKVVIDRATVGTPIAGALQLDNIELR